MIRDSERLLLVAAANRAPSVHNIQPARFRFEDAATITLLGDPQRRLFVGDPEGKDNLKSLGAALEGLTLALGEQGYDLDVRPLDGANNEYARLSILPGAAIDPLARFAESRATYRGMFERPDEPAHAALARLHERCPDLCIIKNRDAIAALAKQFDDVSMEVLRDQAYRAELVSWMRLKRDDPNYARDGLNAEHMAMSTFEAMGAEIVLGRKVFPALDAIGVAKPLISEASKVGGAAGVALFHRPQEESDLETGRRFYRVWLEIESEGLSLCPMSVLADVPHSASALLAEAGLADRKLVSVFRIGRRPPSAPKPPRVRLPAEELIAPA